MRYNPREAFEALYLADTPITALQEINFIKVTDDTILSAKSSPRLLLSVEVLWLPFSTWRTYKCKRH